MRSLLIFLQVVLLSAVIQAEVFKKEKVKIGKKTCLCHFKIKISDKCSGSAKCDKKCSGTGTVELGGCSLTLRVNKGKGKILKCFCKAATIPGSGSGETPVPMIGSGETPVLMTGSGETPVPMTGSGETPVPIPGSGCPPPVGGEGMQCSCNCNCPDGSGECDCKALTCAPGFSKVCPMMGGMCPQEMDPICPYNAMSRMVGNSNDYAWGKDKGCQCLPDFLLAMVMIQPTSRIETGSGSGNGEFGVGGIGSRCACVSKLIFESTAPTESTVATETTKPYEGILIAGGVDNGTRYDVELFLPSTGTSKTCSLMSLAVVDGRDATLNIDDNKPVICNLWSCEVFTGGQWSDYSNPLKTRRWFHQTWFSKDGLVLIGGTEGHLSTGGAYGLTSTEIVPIGGGPSEWGFSLQYNSSHACLIDDGDTFILTGGQKPKTNTNTRAQRYNIQGFLEDLPDLKLGRWRHACGSYKKSDGTLVYLVGGGHDVHKFLVSTEILLSGATSWVDGARLPGPRIYANFVSMYGRLFVTGGTIEKDVLELINEEWKEIGKMQKGRSRHAAVGLHVTPDLMAACQ